jgi:hypothetical protein
MLSLFAESIIEPAEFSSMFGRFARAFADGFDDFNFHCAAFGTLFARVFGQSNRLHGSGNSIFSRWIFQHRSTKVTTGALDDLRLSIGNLIHFPAVESVFNSSRLISPTTNR